jgi:hypothetical protein
VSGNIQLGIGAKTKNSAHDVLLLDSFGIFHFLPPRLATHDVSISGVDDNDMTCHRAAFGTVGCGVII